MLQTKRLLQLRLIDSLRRINLVAQHSKRNAFHLSRAQKTLQLLPSLVKTLGCRSINHKYNAVNLCEVILPDSSCGLVATQIVCLESHASNDKLFKLWVSGWNVLEHFGVAQHMQKRCLASIVEAKEQDVSLEKQETVKFISKRLIVTEKCMPSCSQSQDTPKRSRTNSQET